MWGAGNRPEEREKQEVSWVILRKETVEIGWEKKLQQHEVVNYIHPIA
jgi:hypothetical protein